MTRTVVEFLDITTHDGWINEAEASDYQPLLCTAMGKLVNEDDNLVRLAPLYGPEGRIGYLIAIPKGCIVTRTDF